MKRFVLMTSLVLSVLSLFYVFLAYMGLIRYASIHLSSLNSYIPLYGSLDHHGGGRVVISMSADSENIGSLETTLKSLLDQTVRVDEISLNVPYNCVVPKEYEDVAVVYRYGKDYGECANIIPTLLRENEKDTKIICVENGIVYAADFVENVTRESSANPNNAIDSTWAFLVKPAFFTVEVLGRGKSSYGKNFARERINTRIKNISSSDTFKAMK